MGSRPAGGVNVIWYQKVFLAGVLCIVFLAIMDVPIKIGNPDYLFPNSRFHDPTLAEVEEFLAFDFTDRKEYTDNYRCLNFSRDTCQNAEEYGIRCTVVIIVDEDAFGNITSHAVVAFDTIDEGWRVFEPQTDNLYHRQFVTRVDERVFASPTLISSWNGTLHGVKQAWEFFLLFRLPLFPLPALNQWRYLHE